MRAPIAAMWLLALGVAAEAGDMTPAERREREASAERGVTIEGAAPEGGFARLIPHGLFRDTPSSCDNKRALQKIVHRFAWAERHTWHRGFVIAELREPRLRYPSTDGPSLIAHHHCMAEAVMTDGKSYTVYYTTENDQGFASIGDATTFCVLGLDPWHVYDSACRTLR